jgi:chromobox protein 1
VEHIEDHLWDDNASEFKFKVRWLGYPKEADKTWEPVGNLKTAKDALKEYYKLIGFQPDPDSPNDRGWRGFKIETKKRAGGTAKSSSDDKPRKRKLSKSMEEAPSSGRRGRPKKKRGDSSEEEDSDDIIDAPAKKKALQYPPNSSNWDSAITVVETIEALLDSATGENVNWGIVTWKNGQSEHTKHRLKMLHQRAPQRMLEFYERHL